MNQSVPLTVKGHCLITDDLGNIILDKSNAVHAQNMSRIIARALANESNSSIYRLAFGNGGTSTDIAFTTTYNPVSDGQAPDTAGWTSRLYNEIYSEIIDEGNISLNPLLGTDPGSASNTGTRPGGGSNPINDPASVPHVSGPGVRSTELGLVSRVTITCVLNASEPFGQQPTDIVSPTEYTESSFSFDEIALFSAGASAVDTNGSQDINVGNRTADDDTTLLGSTQYSFRIGVDGGALQPITFTTPAAGSGMLGEITYGDLCEAINTGDVVWNPLWGGTSPLPNNTKITITNTNVAYTTILEAQTYGLLRFISGGIPGPTSAINLQSGLVGINMVGALNTPTGGIVQTAIPGKSAGIQNDPTNPDNERERMLTHLIFSPVLKAANRTYTVRYSLDIAIARTI